MMMMTLHDDDDDEKEEEDILSVLTFDMYYHASPFNVDPFLFIDYFAFG